MNTGEYYEKNKIADNVNIKHGHGGFHVHECLG